MEYSNRDNRKIAADRFREYKESNKLSYDKLAYFLGYKNASYMYQFASNNRRISKDLARRLSKRTGWRVEYWLGIDDYKTETDYRERNPEVPLAKEELYIDAWNKLLHEIAEVGGYDFSFVQDEPDYELKCNYSGAVIPFEELRSDILDYAKFYINQKIAKSKKEEK